MAAALVSAGATGEDIQGALTSLGQLVDFRRLRPGNVLKARFDAGDRLVSVDVSSSLLERAPPAQRPAASHI